MHTYFFRCFGLSISSEIALPCIAVPPHAAPDLHICSHGAVSKEMLPPIPAHAQYLNQGECQWRDDAGNWHVHYTDILNGAELHFELRLAQKRVDICWTGAVSVEDIPRVILGPVCGRFLLWSGRLAMHGNAVQIDDAAVLFCADSGGGKSTASAAMVDAGFPLVCDDIATIQTDPGSVALHPGYPHLRLWPDSAAHLGEKWRDLPTVFHRTETMGNKYYRDLQREPALFCDTMLPLRAIYLLQQRIAGNVATTITPMSARSAFPSILRNIFLKELLKIDSTMQLFPAVSALANLVPVFAVSAPDGLGYLSAFSAAIVQHARDSSVIIASVRDKRNRTGSVWQ